jgi:hypothetical protein
VRGLTTPIVWWDEFAFLKYNSIIYESASPAQSRAQEEARKNGIPAFKAITTTPSDLDADEGIYCKEMMDMAAAFNERMYDMSMEELNDYLEVESKNGWVYIEFSYRQLGRDDKWFKGQCKDLNFKLLKIKREVLLQWTKTNDSSVYSEESVENLYKYQIEHTEIDSPIPQYKLHAYRPFDLNGKYVAGVDVAGGLDRDSSTITFTEESTGLPVISFANKNIDTNVFHDLIIKLMDMFPNTIFAIERNSYGLGIIQRIAATKYKKQLYCKDATKTDREKINSDITKSSLKAMGSGSFVYGIDTSAYSRSIMFDILNDVILNAPETFGYMPLIKEISTLQYNKDGKIEHAQGCHDDIVLSFLISRYAMRLNTDFAATRRSLSEHTAQFKQVSNYNLELDPSKQNNIFMNQQINNPLIDRLNQGYLTEEAPTPSATDTKKAGNFNTVLNFNMEEW